MPFTVKSNKTGATYYLHSKEFELNGSKRKLFFFSKDLKEEIDGTLSLDVVPEGYAVTEARTGLPLLKKTTAEK